MKKQTIVYTVIAFLLISGLFLSAKGASANSSPFSIIDLEPGWNIVSTPMVLSSYEFSVPETFDNFDIYLLDPTSPSGWNTMQGAGHSKFEPLFAYFINNKTGQKQTLRLNYNLDLTPAQRLFQRTLYPGWNAIGIASPNYAISRGTAAGDTNNPSRILSSIINSIGSVIDFTAGNNDLDSLKITDLWIQKIALEVNSLNDFREYKGYGVFLTEETQNYHGFQNIPEERETAALEVSANVDNPKDRPVIVSDTAVTSGVVLLKANVKAKNNTAILRTVVVGTPGATSGSVASGTMSVLYLYDGDTMLSSTSSIAAETAVFSNVNLTIPKDTTKTLTVKADLNKTAGYYVEGASSTITLADNTTGLAAEDATTFVAATVSGSPVTSGGAYLYVKAPSLALSTASISRISVATGTVTYNGKADARIKINLTAQGGNIYVASSTANDVTATTTLGASTTVVESISTNADASSGGNWVVYSGDTKGFEIYAQITVTDWGATDAATYVYLTNLKWATTDAGAAASYTNQTWGLTDFKTGSVVLEYFR